MRWRDVRFELPNDPYDYTVWKRDDKGVCVAWMPVYELPDFNPVPDPPEGWRFVEPNEAVNKEARYWSISGNKWSRRGTDGEYDKYLIYIVPKEPEGYRYITESDEFDRRALWWDVDHTSWKQTTLLDYDRCLIYVVPVVPKEEGYRYTTKDDVWDKRALWWDKDSLTWEKTNNNWSNYNKALNWNKALVYIVPIEKSEDASVKPESFSDLVSRHARELLEIIESDDLNDSQKFALKFIHSTLESAQKLF